MKRILFFNLVLLFAVSAVNAQSESSGKELRMASDFWGSRYYIGNDKVSSKEFAEAIKQEENAYKLFKSGKNLATGGTVVAAVGAFCFGYDLGSRIGGRDGSTGLLVGGGIATVGGIVLGLIGEGKMKKAINLFNDEREAYRIQFKASPRDVGLCLFF